MDELEKHFEDGWDDGVQYYERTYGKNFWTELYWYAFKFATDGDYDGGVCFKIRQDAVEHLNRGFKKLGGK